MERKYRKIKFAIEAEDRVFNGFMPLDLKNEPFGGYWNGWLCPYVDGPTHMEIIAYLREGVMGREEEEEEFLEYLAEVAGKKPNADGLYYWGGWLVWDEVEQDDEEKDGFHWNGFFITDPWMSECGRFQVIPVQYYGKAYIEWVRGGQQ